MVEAETIANQRALMRHTPFHMVNTAADDTGNRSELLGVCNCDRLIYLKHNYLLFNFG